MELTMNYEATEIFPLCDESKRRIQNLTLDETFAVCAFLGKEIKKHGSIDPMLQAVYEEGVKRIFNTELTTT